MDALEDFNIYIINYWVLILAVFIIIFLSFLEKRKSRQDLCQGRPSLLIPFRFLDGYENRTAYAMAFGTTTSIVVSLITSERTLEFDLPLWASALYVYLQAMVGCLTCFPLFACLTTRYRAVGAVLCILYSLLWLALELVQLIKDVALCETCNTSNSQYNDTAAMDVDRVYHTLQGLPVIFCYLVLVIYCFYILRRCYTTKTYISKCIGNTLSVHQEEYVRWVFRKFRMKLSDESSTAENMASKTFIEQMNDSIRLRYFTNFPFFRYPARIVALSFVQLNILYWAGLLLMSKAVSILYPLIHAELTQKYVQQYAIDLTIIMTVCSGFALITSVLNGLAQIFVAARNYRYDMLNIYQGKKIVVAVANKTPQNILTRSMTFPGYQVAFMLWGVLLCFTTVLLLTLIPVLIFYITAKLDVLSDLIQSILQLSSFPATVFVVFYLQVFMTKQVLLQEKITETDKNPPLNVDNRKFYEIINYYSLFTNMAVGLLTCLFRIIQSAFFGIFSIARLDRSVFPHEIEDWDRGYAAYTSMLLVDNAHNNPSMRVFAHLLWTKTLAARSKQVQESSEVALLIPDHGRRHVTAGKDTATDETPTPSNPSENPWIFVGTNEIQPSNRAQIRWFLTYTLVNNPQLCKFRKLKLTKTSADRKFSDAKEAADNNSRTDSDIPLLVDISDSPLLVDISDSPSSSSFTPYETDQDVLLRGILSDSVSGSSA